MYFSLKNRLAVTIGVCLLYAIGIVVRAQYGIGVSILNCSEGTLRNVNLIVQAQGKKYSLPDLPPGGRVWTYVWPMTESEISLEFRDERERVDVETVLGYAEADYRGNVRARILHGGTIQLHNSFPQLVYWKSWFDFV